MASDALVGAGGAVIGVLLGQVGGIVRDVRRDRHDDRHRLDEADEARLRMLEQLASEQQRAIDLLVAVPAKLDAVHELVVELKALVGPMWRDFERRVG